MRLTKLLFTALILFTALPGCDDEPEDLLSEETYTHVFSELLILRQMNDRQLQSASRDSLELRIYDKYDISREQFEVSHHYYQKNPEEHFDRIERVREILEEEQITIRKFVEAELEKKREESDENGNDEEPELNVDLQGQ